VLDVLMLSGGHAGLSSDPGILGGFYDAQARAMLDAKLAVDPALVGFEGFLIDGSTYVYFGPIPSILRMPVLLVTDGLDGRLTQLSMLLAFGVLLAAGARLHWQARSLVRPDAPAGRTDSLLAFLMAFTLGAGAVPLFLAARPVVYHETELWGAALGVACLGALVAVIQGPSARRIVVAGVLATLAINTRVPAGLGPVLGLLGLAGLVALGRLGVSGPRKRTAALLTAAALLVLGSSAAVNIAKFGTPFGIPLDKQAYSSLDPNRQAALAANDGSLFGAKFVPTTLVQAVRPDALGTTRAFPFLGLPRDRAPVIGDARFDTLERSLSAPTSMPLFCLLALVGLAAAVRSAPLRPLLAIALASAAGAGVSLTIAYVTTRYLADFVPFLFLGAVIGLQVLLRATEKPDGVARGRGRVALLAVAGVLALVGLVVNGSVGLVTQRLLSPETAEADRAGFVKAQNRVDELLGRSPGKVAVGESLPDEGVPGDLFVLGDCDGLYVAGHSGWLAVERTERTGVRRLAVRFAGSGSNEREALAIVGRGAQRVTIASGPGRELAILVDDEIVGRGSRPGAGDQDDASMKLSFDEIYAGTYFATLEVDGRVVSQASAPYDRRATLRLGAGSGLPRFSGRVRSVASPEPSACRRLLR